MLEPFDQPLASGFGDSAGFMDMPGGDQGSAFDSLYKFLDNSGRLLTMMRYLQPRELERRGLDKFDAWAGTYGVVNESLEPTPSGGYAVTARFSRFTAQSHRDVSRVRHRGGERRPGQLLFCDSGGTVGPGLPDRSSCPRCCSVGPLARSVFFQARSLEGRRGHQSLSLKIPQRCYNCAPTVAGPAHDRHLREGTIRALDGRKDELLSRQQVHKPI